MPRRLSRILLLSSSLPKGELPELLTLLLSRSCFGILTLLLLEWFRVSVQVPSDESFIEQGFSRVVEGRLGHPSIFAQLGEIALSRPSTKPFLGRNEYRRRETGGSLLS